MKYIVIEEFPEGDFNIPVLDNGSQPIFDDLDEAIAFSEELQNGYVLPLFSVANYKLTTPRIVAKMYYALSTIMEVPMEDIQTTRKSEVMYIKNAIRYYLRTFAQLEYRRIGELEKIALELTTIPKHDTIINSVSVVENNMYIYKQYLYYLKSIG